MAYPAHPGTTPLHTYIIAYSTFHVKSKDLHVHTALMYCKNLDMNNSWQKLYKITCLLKLSIYPPFQNYQSENSRMTATKKSSTSSMRAAAVASSEEHYASSRKCIG